MKVGLFIQITSPPQVIHNTYYCKKYIKKTDTNIFEKNDKNRPTIKSSNKALIF